MNKLLVNSQGKAMSVNGMALVVNDNPYITDGLVFYLDGINKGQNIDAWTDLVNGVIFQNSGATSVSTGWETGNAKKLINSDTLSFPYSTHTIEVVITRNGTIQQGQTDVVNFLDASSVVLSYDSTGVYFGRGGNVGNVRYTCNVPASNQNGSFCLSANSARLVVNGVSFTGIGASSIGTSTYNSIGSRGNGSYYFTGIVHSVRIYNRQLSVAEMTHNQQIDNERFNLGLNI